MKPKRLFTNNLLPKKNFTKKNCMKKSSFSAPSNAATQPSATTAANTVTSSNRPLVTAPSIAAVYASRAGLQDEPSVREKVQPTTAATEVTLPLRQRGAASTANRAAVDEKGEIFKVNSSKPSLKIEIFYRK